MITKLSLKERIDLARQGALGDEQLLKLIEDLWREIERLRKHYQER